MIKAIETVHRGYNFRSRTEARWAVFFDHLDWKWQYEAEGYHLPSGPYLPDFYFPDQHMFVEVKGLPFTASEKLKCKELSLLPIPEYPEYTHSVFMVVGPPECQHYGGFHNGEEFDIGIFVEKGHKFYPVDYSMDFYKEDYPRTYYAINAAKAARFEHGQQPQKSLQITEAEIEAMWQKAGNGPQKISAEEYQKMLDANKSERIDGVATKIKKFGEFNHDDI